jgi:TPR repeat protein
MRRTLFNCLSASVVPVLVLARIVAAQDIATTQPGSQPSLIRKLTPNDVLMFNGQEYFNGDKTYGVPQDYAKAMDCFRKAADAGDAKAMWDIGVIYDRGGGVPRDHAQAMIWYRKSADAGNALAMYWLGELCASGPPKNRDYAQAIAWFSKAVAAGDQDANPMIDYCQRQVAYLQQHPSAQPSTQPTEAQTSAGALATLAPNVPSTQPVQQQIAEQTGNPLPTSQPTPSDGIDTAADALANGLIYFTGYGGTPQDYSKALYWFRKAAESGNAEAITHIGEMYAGGLGVPKDVDQAKICYARAIQKGDARAMYDMGEVYLDDVPSSQRHASDDAKYALYDYQQALDCFRQAQAADAGDAMAKNDAHLSIQTCQERLSDIEPTSPRFEVIQCPLKAELMFRLDTVTGDTWLLVQQQDGGIGWKQMNRIFKPSPPGGDIMGWEDLAPQGRVNFKIFTSTLRADCTMLINVNTGDTWDCENDPKTGSLIWTPMKSQGF